MHPDHTEYADYAFGTVKRDTANTGKSVGAVVAAVRILRYLSDSPEPLASNRIARDLQLNPSTCFNILKTLEREGLTYSDPETKRFRLGFLLVELGGGALAHLGYRELIHPHIEAIATKHQSTATLWLRTGPDRVRLVDLVDGGGPIKIAMSIGQRLPLLAGALGRCFAGHGEWDQDMLKRLFAQVRNFEPLSFQEFMLQAKQASEIGYAVDTGNFAGGVTAISAPILDHGGHAVMAISVVNFLSYLDQARINAIGQDLKEASALITRRLAGMPELAKGYEISARAK